jgi:membrane protein DedA with SNARE-associated domain
VLSFRYLLLRHGYLFLFFYVLAAQLGLPLPADPLLLLMGALVGDHRYSLMRSFFAALIAAVAGDHLWYQLGRMRGHSILGVICKLSLEPDTCVRKTEVSFTKRGAAALLFAKFVPGMSLVSMPLAGMIGMPRGRFLLADAAGCALWTAGYLTLGLLFHHQVDLLIRWLGLFGRRAGLVILALITLYAGIKYLQRWRVRRNLRINRVTPQEVLDLLDAAAPVKIVDLRHPAEVERERIKLPGALLLSPDNLRAHASEIPPDHDIILYCT